MPLVCDGGFVAGLFTCCWAEDGDLPRSLVERLDVGEPTPAIKPAYAGPYPALVGDTQSGQGTVRPMHYSGGQRLDRPSRPRAQHRLPASELLILHHHL